MIATAQKPPRTTGLSAGHFRKVAIGGFGDGSNSYAWGRCWFNDHLYIGTNRDVLMHIIRRYPFELPLQSPPVRIPENAELGRGEIWRFHPATETWTRVYRSPIVKGNNGLDVPLAYGFRNLTVFQGKSDSQPAIYTIPLCGKDAPGPVMLRSEDGFTFERVSKPGLGLADTSIASFRPVVPFKGQLFSAPSGSRGGDSNVAYTTVVLCNDDPAHGEWARSCPYSFGDPTNTGIFDLAVHNGFLYAGVVNIRYGCQLWKTDAEGPAPHHWTKVADLGFDRGIYNQMIISLASFGEAMYVGTAIQNGGYDRWNNVGPAAAEVIKVYPDDSWDLLVGEPRMTRTGLKIPSSGYGPGFNNPFAGYIWRMTVHDGCLYAGTMDTSSFLPYVDFDRTDTPYREKMLGDAAIETFLQHRGGTELWRTSDGDQWTPVTVNGLDNRYNYGIRSLISTPRGLFVGTANPFGPQVAIRDARGWHYEDNPQGGLEIWHGSLDQEAESHCHDARDRAVDESPSYGRESQASDDIDALVQDGEAALLTELSETQVSFIQETNDRYANHDLDNEEWLFQLVDDYQSHQGPRNTVEEEIQRYFGDTGFRFAGIGRDEETSPAAACRELIREIIQPLGDRDPGLHLSILVIGASAEAVGEEIAQQRPQDAITSLSIQQCQPGRKRRWWPARSRSESTFQLPCENASQDVMIWIGPHSNLNRADMLTEVYRALRPQGMLLGSDLVGSSIAEPAEGLHLAADEALRKYETELMRAGFDAVNLLDITSAGWQRFLLHSRKYFSLKLMLQQIDREWHDEILRNLPGSDLLVDAHVIMSARKPESSANRCDGQTIQLGDA